MPFKKIIIQVMRLEGVSFSETFPSQRVTIPRQVLAEACSLLT